MSYDLSTESWSLEQNFLPTDLQASSREFGALRRAREVKDEEVLLQRLLMRAAEQGLAKVSSVALFKRLRAAEPWPRHLTAQMAGTMAEQMRGANGQDRR